MNGLENEAVALPWIRGSDHLVEQSRSSAPARFDDGVAQLVEQQAGYSMREEMPAMTRCGALVQIRPPSTITHADCRIISGLGT